MMILGVVLIIVAGGLTYWGYVIWSQQNLVRSGIRLFFNLVL